MNRDLRSRLFVPVDIASLVVFRVLFGAIMLWEVCRYFDHQWIQRYYIQPKFFFTYYGFHWIHPWPGIGMYVHFVGLGVLAIFIMAGLWYRVCALLFFLGFTYVFLLDQTNYLNHFYFVSLMSFLMIFTPAHRAASIDAWRRPGIRSTHVPAWTLWLPRAQLGIVYLGAGVAKLNSDWLHCEPMRMWLTERIDYTLLGGSLPIGQLFAEEWVVYLFSYGGLLFDLLITPGLVWKRTRPFAFVLVVLFHLMNAILFDIGIFPWLSIVATLLFLPPDWPRRIIRRWRLVGEPVFDVLPKPSRPAGRSAVLAFIGIYLTIQVLMPLRHFLYPGSVHWTEEGHRFSWHMKLRDKSAQATFTATDPASGKVWQIKPKDYLTKRQREKMKKHPDMVLQFAHHVANEIRRKTQRDVEIRAKVLVSLNGRDRQLQIDPTVNLAAQERSLLPVSWILPLREPLPD